MNGLSSSFVILLESDFGRKPTGVISFSVKTSDSNNPINNANGQKINLYSNPSPTL